LFLSFLNQIPPLSGEQKVFLQGQLVAVIGQVPLRGYRSSDNNAFIKQLGFIRYGIIYQNIFNLNWS